MKLLQDLANRHGIFYGWFVLAGVMLVIFVVGGSLVNAFGVFLPVICNHFGWGRATVAAALSLGVLFFGLPSPLFGMLVLRWGPRFTFILGNSLAALGLAMMSLVQEVWHVYLLYIFIGFSAGLGGYISSATTINNWFIRKRSLAMAMFIGCTGFAGFVFPPFVTLLIGALGWRSTWLALAGSIIVISVFFGSFVLIRNRPEDMGLLPDGQTGKPIREQKSRSGQSEAQVAQVPSKARHALGMSTTWLIGVFVAANAYVTGTLSAHQIAYLQDLGFAAITAATAISVMAAANTFGCLIFGTLAMRFRVRTLAIGAFIVQLTGLLILLSTEELTFVYLYVAMIGMSSGSVMTALPTLVGVYYERERYSQVLGIVFPFQPIAMAVAATAAGAIYDITASYTLAFFLAISMSLTGLVGAFLARPPRGVILIGNNQ
jgi:MFS family permease